ncbi:MAG TPA: DinB family protein [Candidatus Angelobacter sp.]|nr:DinB family protein [Candidatus Angelobacter sp.]
MTAEERAHAMKMLEAAEKEYLASIRDVNDAQWGWKPAPERWSVGETAEHILLGEAVIFRSLLRAIQSPPVPDWESKTAGKTEFLERALLDRRQKAISPPSLHPQGLSREETVRRFREQRVEIVKFAAETQVFLQEHTADHPFPLFNTLNGYQWLILIAGHTMRHNLQIAEVKATPGYPG